MARRKKSIVREIAGTVVTDRTEEGGRLVERVAGGLRAVREQSLRPGMQGDVAEFPALAVHAKMRRATAQVHVMHFEIVSEESSSRRSPW